MLDLKFIRENPEKVKQGAKNKGVKVDIDMILELDKKHREVLHEIDELNSKHKKEAEKIRGLGGHIKSEIYIENIRTSAVTKLEIRDLGKELVEIEEKLNKLLLLVPNLPLDDVPIGKDERDNKVLREVGKKTKFDFKVKTYLELAEKLDLIDTKRAAKVSGTRFGYLKNQAALLEFALVKFVMNLALNYGFIPIVPPVLIKKEAMRGMGYLDRGEEEIYHLEKDDLYLVGTSEQSVGPMHMGEIFAEDDLPRRYVAFSTCFRREAGSYGRDTKGILRVHQFDKVEMFSFCSPEDSKIEHQLFLKLEEEIMKALDIPYRVMEISTGDLGDPAAAKFDIEAWLPAAGEYRETHSTSNTTDFQARRLNIRFKRERDAKNDFVHTINGTAAAIGRIIIAILENYQQRDGSVKIPKVLQKYLDFKEIK